MPGYSAMSPSSPSGAAAPLGSPHSDLTCSAEMNSACAKVFAAAKTLVRRSRAAPSAMGPRRSWAKERAGPPYGRPCVRFRVDYFRLKKAFMPGYSAMSPSSPSGAAAPLGSPHSDLTCSAEMNSACAKVFAAAKTLVRRSRAAPSAMGPRRSWAKERAGPPYGRPCVRFRVDYFRLKKAFMPGYSAISPSSSSMRSSWLYLATRSVRLGAPVLIWPALRATAMSAMVASSVSPER